MASTAEKSKVFLGDFRIVLPALGAIFGFQLVVAFQPTFGDLPRLAQVANFVGAACTAVAIVFLLAPVGYHRFTDEIDESRSFLRFAQRMVSLAFVFVPFSLALSIYVQAARTFGGAAPAVLLGLAAAMLALCALFWWWLPWRKAKALEAGTRGRGGGQETEGQEREGEGRGMREEGQATGPSGSGPGAPRGWAPGRGPGGSR